MRRITIELTSPHLSTMRAVNELLREPGLAARLRIARDSQTQPGPGVLRIESASAVRPVLTILCGDEPHEPSAADVSIALSQEIWADAVAHEPWRVTAAPMPERARLFGKPDPKRAWVLVGPGLQVSVDQVAALTGIENPQLHFIGLGSALGEDRAVRWLPRRAVISALLGKVDAVLAPPGPLAWDAARAGVPTHYPPNVACLPPELVALRLTRTVPTALVGDRNFWRRLAKDLAETAPSAPWGTAAWVLQGRNQVRDRQGQSVFKLAAAKRKLRKLRSDPVAFWADSWLVRRAGHTWRGA